VGDISAFEPAGTPGGERRYRSGSPFEELALTMGLMVLAVVVLPPDLVCLLDLRPGARIGERMVSKPSLN
jgi:hypothetical protein